MFEGDPRAVRAAQGAQQGLWRSCISGFGGKALAAAASAPVGWPEGLLTGRGAGLLTPVWDGGP